VYKYISPMRKLFTDKCLRIITQKLDAILHEQTLESFELQNLTFRNPFVLRDGLNNSIYLYYKVI